jgi:hypothetical protein
VGTRWNALDKNEKDIEPTNALNFSKAEGSMGERRHTQYYGVDGAKIKDGIRLLAEAAMAKESIQFEKDPNHLMEEDVGLDELLEAIGATFVPDLGDLDEGSEDDSEE